MDPVPAAATHAFGKYTLVAKLATGGMAEIFLARLQGAAGFEKLVCIKRILPHLAKDGQLVGMFLAEARIAAQISHPNVCQVFELGDIDGRYFIAMEYLEGVPFSCFRRRDMYGPPPDPRLVAALGVQACEGLHHAHQLKRPDGTPLEVVHRDVSANNLFATVDGAVKVLDFGIAKVQDASVRTSTGSVKGTYAYMAPEQLRGERLDRRTDVFAIGIVLWELFARRHLFRRETDYLTFQAITADPIPEVAELRPDVPPELSAAIARALSRNRDERFATARALGDALARAVAPLGGPWTSPQIGDEIARAFTSRLRDQQRLVRIAREGSTLDLGDDLGPAVGHGTELNTTPLSIITSRSDTISQRRATLGEHRTTRDPMPAVPPPAELAAPPAPELMFEVAAPPPGAPRRSRLPLVLLALFALGAGAVAAYGLLVRLPAPQAARGAIGAGGPPPAPVVVADAAVIAADAAEPAVVVAVSDAGAGDAAAEDHDAGAPADAAESVIAVRPPIDAGTPSRRDRSGQGGSPSSPAAPRGPPGKITIDSTPVYAVIYIRGRRYGETPLVGIELPPGRHPVRAVSTMGTQNLTIVIESGRVAPTRRIEWR